MSYQEERNLKDAFGSISAADRTPAKPRIEATPQPREDKPSEYYLFRDGRLENSCGNAAMAVSGLLKEPMDKYTEDLSICDDKGNRLAHKELYEIENKSNAVKPTREGMRIELSEEMQHDLASEGYDPTRPKEIDDQMAERHEAAERGIPAGPAMEDWKAALMRMAADPGQSPLAQEPQSEFRVWLQEVGQNADLQQSAAVPVHETPQLQPPTPGYEPY